MVAQDFVHILNFVPLFTPSPCIHTCNNHLHKYTLYETLQHLALCSRRDFTARLWHHLTQLLPLEMLWQHHLFACGKIVNKASPYNTWKPCKPPQRVWCVRPHSASHPHKLLQPKPKQQHLSATCIAAPNCVLVLVLQGEERVRRSVLLEGGKLLTHYYSDALTMYEVFLRGIRESSQFRSYWLLCVSEIKCSVCSAAAAAGVHILFAFLSLSN